MSSYPPPEGVSTSYNSYVWVQNAESPPIVIVDVATNSYPSISRAAPAPCPSNPVVHIVHHSKHHSSSKNKHNDHHKHSGHGHSHSHSPHRMPSPTPFPIPSTSFTVPSPHVHFPTVPHRPLIHSRSTNALLPAPSHDYLQLQPPPPTHSTNHTHHTHVTKPKPPKNAPVPLNPDFEYSKCTGRRRALCVHSFFCELHQQFHLTCFILFRSVSIIEAKRTNWGDVSMMPITFANSFWRIITSGARFCCWQTTRMIRTCYQRMITFWEPWIGLFAVRDRMTRCFFIVCYRFFDINVILIAVRFWPWWTNSWFGWRWSRWLGRRRVTFIVYRVGP